MGIPSSPPCSKGRSAPRLTTWLRGLAAVVVAWLACFCAAVPPVLAQPAITFNPLSNSTLSAGQPFDFVIRIDFGPTGQFLNGSITVDGNDVTGPFIAALNAGAIQTITAGTVVLLTVPQVTLQTGPHTVLVSITTSTGSAMGQWTATVVPPTTTPISLDQQSLIALRGNPDYITIVFNDGPQRREETWKYAAIRKLYTFHDGARVDETNEPSMPSVPRKPPKLNPMAFTRNMTLGNLIQSYGPVTQTENVSRPAFTLVVHHFRTQGLMAGFRGSALYLIDSVDLP